ncbi:MAG: hypothetical protein MI808_21055 [Pseudomonadales bacterium]|nr:hypothetical protein [Pseudomonadales bacterium]
MRHFLSKSFNILSAGAAALLLATPHIALADPFLAFSDLISGPDTGIGDGKGSGVIVTVWGQGLGSSQGTSKIYYTDSSGTKREAAHVYYWKNADGELPSGPANLYESHKMQEIAFSVPDSANGVGEIHVEVKKLASNPLPFTVRAGQIFHITGSGSDSNSGSFSSPWASFGEANSSAPSGSTIYLHDLEIGSPTSKRGIYWSGANANSTLEAQYAVVAYPGYQPTVTGKEGVQSYQRDGMVVSKLDIYSSNNLSVDAYGQPSNGNGSGPTFGINSTADGRAVANRIGDIPGGCSSKYQGAISGAAKFYNYVSNFKALGNEVYDYGCNGSTKLHHTTYMSIRSDGKNLKVTPWEFGYNYLHGNKAKFGIHQFDQNVGCGQFEDKPIRIHNNVVIDQAGAGISVGSECWTVDVEIENNVLINVGLAADWDGKDPNTSDGPENGGISIRDSGLKGTVTIRNNLIHGFTADNQEDGTGGRACLNFYGSQDNVVVLWDNNICYTDEDRPFMGSGYNADNKYDNVTGSNNVWYYSGSSPSFAKVPFWSTNHITTNPNIVVDGAEIEVGNKDAVVVDKAPASDLERDIYGKSRGSKPDIGPVEFFNPPSPPPWE